MIRTKISDSQLANAVDDLELDCGKKKSTKLWIDSVIAYNEALFTLEENDGFTCIDEFPEEQKEEIIDSEQDVQFKIHQEKSKNVWNNFIERTSHINVYFAYSLGIEQAFFIEYLLDRETKLLDYHFLNHLAKGTYYFSIDQEIIYYNFFILPERIPVLLNELKEKNIIEFEKHEKWDWYFVRVHVEAIRRLLLGNAEWTEAKVLFKYDKQYDYNQDRAASKKDDLILTKALLDCDELLNLRK